MGAALTWLRKARATIRMKEAIETKAAAESEETDGRLFGQPLMALLGPACRGSTRSTA